MSTQTETAMATIEAAAKVILTQLNHCTDTQTAFEHIAYAAAAIGYQANAGIAERSAAAN
jgi:hypothetical protein